MPSQKKCTASLLDINLRAGIITLVSVVTMMTIVLTPALAQTLTVLHTFTGGADGATPIGLTQDAAGNFYGTTMDGGSITCTFGCGTVYKLVHHGSSWLMSPIYEFTAADKAFNPQARVVFGPDGSLYGTALNGGSCSLGWCGAVFKLQPPLSACKTAICPWHLTVLHNFAAGEDGSSPSSEVAFDPAGNIYGTTLYQGSPTCVIAGISGCGTVFKLSHNPDGSWTNTTLYEFQGPNDGAWPYAGVVLDPSGNIYGVTDVGGTGPCDYGWGCGSVFELSPSGSGWVETILHEFSGGSDGGNPDYGLIFDSAGNLLGTATTGGAGLGTVFELTPGQQSWAFNPIYTFAGSQANGPSSKLTMNASGDLFGTSTGGGVYGFGTAYKLTAGNGVWNYSSLHDFDLQGSDGGEPVGGVVFDANGNVYGTAATGPYPSPDDGVLFQITP
jgi:hypothetical protein